MPSEPQIDPFEAAQFFMIGAITAINPRKDTFHVGRTEIVAEKRHLVGFLVGMRVEVLGIERDGRRIASRVTSSQ